MAPLGRRPPFFDFASAVDKSQHQCWFIVRPCMARVGVSAHGFGLPRCCCVGEPGANCCGALGVVAVGFFVSHARRPCWPLSATAAAHLI
eukprot:2887592-Alexandrium_andersonii.AAC.1